jgi:hypothetical protein
MLCEGVNPSGIQLAAHLVEIQSPIGNAVIDEQDNYWSIDIEHNVCIHSYVHYIPQMGPDILNIMC